MKQECLALYDNIGNGMCLKYGNYYSYAYFLNQVDILQCLAGPARFDKMMILLTGLGILHET